MLIDWLINWRVTSTFVVFRLYCGKKYDYKTFRHKSNFSLLTFVLWGGNLLFMLFVFIHAYWCPTRFSCQMTLILFSINTTHHWLKSLIYNFNNRMCIIEIKGWLTVLSAPYWMFWQNMIKWGWDKIYRNCRFLNTYLIVNLM